MTLKARTILLLMSLVAGAQAQAKLLIDIVGGIEDPEPIAVVPFGWDGGLAKAPMDVAEIVSDDLARSGWYAPLRRNQMVEYPTRGIDIDFDDWRLLGADFVIVGRLFAETTENYVIRYEMYNAITRDSLIRGEERSSRTQLRSAAHRVADRIYEELRGVPGAFDTRIAFIRVEKNSSKEVFKLIVADADGETENTILESPEPLMSPAWSPDGRRMAYVSFEGGVSSIYVQTLRTGGRRKVSSRKGVNGAPAWSPDGRRLAVTLSKTDGNLDVYVLDLTNQVLTRLTWHSAIDTEPYWAGDGNTVYFTSDRSGGPQVYSVTVDDLGRPKRLTFEGNYNARPRISPDQARVAVVYNERGNYRIAVVELDNGQLDVLTTGRLDESPSFAPNGETIIYATRDKNRGMGVLATVSVDGRIHRILGESLGDVREPVWAPYKPF